MPKRFKFRLSGVIPSFHFCRPKHSSDLPSDPFLSSLPPCLRHRSPSPSNTANRHVFPSDDFLSLPRRKIYNSAASDDDEPLPLHLPPAKARRRIRIRKKKRFFSDDEEDESGEEAESETLVSNSNSSRSFSTDSSTEFSPHLETIREVSAIRPKKLRNYSKKKKIRKAITSNKDKEEEEEFVAARLSAVFQRLVPCAAVEGKVRESLAVVKTSEEPYEDFKSSMGEMIVDKEMVEERDLQELLRCFLSLNSEQHHGIIIRAFHDICHALFVSHHRSH